MIRILLACVLLASLAGAQSFPPDSHGRNYDEAQVGPLVLPDPLVFHDGRRATDPLAWSARRTEILRDFRDHMYGHTPDLPIRLQAKILAEHTDAVGGLATRTIVQLRFFDGDAPGIQLMIYTPNDVDEAVPVFLGMSFYGNASIEDDPRIPLPSGWMRPHRTPGVVENNRTLEGLRGVSSSRWPLSAILERGYGLATFYYGDVEPDHLEGWRDGIRGYALRRSGRSERGVDAWGAIGAWAWGLSRALDYLETRPEIDAERVALIGHSRLAKAALWAGAQDERFALVVSNNSGEGGASLARRNFGENIAYSIAHASWRYSIRFKEYVDRADELPFDQHMLLGLVAPRPLYVASATEDGLADPKGEFLSALHAGPVYELFGLPGVGVEVQPPPDYPVGGSIGYHVRTGSHDLTEYDWERYLDFADRRLGSR